MRVGYWVGLLLLAVAARTSAAEPPVRERGVAAEVTPVGVWLGYGADLRCFVAREAGTLDHAALERELLQLRGDDRSSMEVSAVRGVIYQEMVAVMDLAAKVGLSDVRVGAPDEIRVAFDDTAAARAAAPAHCSRPPNPAPLPKPQPSPPSVLPRPATHNWLIDLITGWMLTRQQPLPPPVRPDFSKLPVIIVTRTDVLIAGKRLCAVAGLADGKGVIQPVVTALKDVIAGGATDNHVVILQADESLDAVVIVRVLASSKAAGYPDALFAVKNR